LVFPTASVIIAASAFLFSYQRASKSDLEKIKSNAAASEQASKSNFEKVKQDAVALEHRLTLNEQNQFNENDRRCLQEVVWKMGLFWDTVKTDFPKLLRQEKTPRFDALLDKAEANIGLLSPNEVNELTELLTNIVESAKNENVKKREKPDRAMMAAFYRKVLQYESNGGKNTHGC